MSFLHDSTLHLSESFRWIQLNDGGVGGQNPLRLPTILPIPHWSMVNSIKCAIMESSKTKTNANRFLFLNYFCAIFLIFKGMLKDNLKKIKTLNPV